MLQALHVRNFAVIEDARLELDPALTVLTGETGAGKSILIGALQLLLGDRASTDQVRTGTDKALIQGEFAILENHPCRHVLERYGIAVEEDLLIVRREVGGDGRSRAFLNDTAVTVGVLKEVGESLVDLHGQHDHQSLLHPSQHLLLLDAYAGLTSDREAYAEKLSEYRCEKERLDELKRREVELAEKLELYEFQLMEIDSLDPQEGEEEELERELRILEGAEQLSGGFAELIQTLSEGETAVIDQLERPGALLEGLSAIDAKVTDILKLLNDSRLALQEAVYSSQRYLDEFDFDQERLDQVRTRHSNLIYMAKKYGGSVDALIEKRRQLKEAMDKGSIARRDRSGLEAETESLRSEAAQLAMGLSKRRGKAVKGLQKQVEEELKELAMSESAFMVEVEAREDPEGWLETEDGKRYAAGPTGMDRVEFRLRTSPAANLMPLQKVASGGEISRVMLALKSVFGSASMVSTLVFDEIDSGIGGKTADRVAEKLSLLAGDHQVLVITHLPQIARRGQRHLVVEKTINGGLAQARIRCVDGEERTQALAVLMSGEAETEAVLDHARAMLGERKGGESRA
jgi:DNA repair protein RecN (Recombination protein N)